ncbi:hypothetical protein COU19_02495 [Candidatus Kaiserbacteria bacterium CG10_big_fil_rev_8_21_14_0_10_56_12]|uniref:Uncharacterized protein n=1 Tax=Candidatus Kaiserbacteria bacterium CG10_big_fil_rev_8_21_14_0_10_56_12 TaxID=1974611 RepID=A0A2H0U9E3_9BACT|nr:MAG: hypothetical protein COU19_02495 [Candidatus Kaiserbacteria bacterium CG10_big_fil_rev_8_21_14_0_10_56_12]
MEALTRALNTVEIIDGTTTLSQPSCEEELVSHETPLEVVQLQSLHHHCTFDGGLKGLVRWWFNMETRGNDREGRAHFESVVIAHATTELIQTACAWHFPDHAYDGEGRPMKFAIRQGWRVFKAPS